MDLIVPSITHKPMDSATSGLDSAVTYINPDNEIEFEGVIPVNSP